MAGMELMMVGYKALSTFSPFLLLPLMCSHVHTLDFLFLSGGEGERERVSERERAGEGERERERENPKQAPCPV